jgi:SAM-dependent methyltransferase
VSPFGKWARRLWSRAEAEFRAEITDALEPDGSARLLDAGCDDGAWTEVLRRKIGVPPSQVSGIDLVQQRIQLARARGFDVREADLDDRWPFEDGTFDIVHANQVIEHVSRVDHFVEETRRVLRPDGTAIIGTENLASWHNIAALALGYQPFSLTNISSRRPIGNPLALHAGEPSELESWQHRHVLSLAALRDIFVAHGFRIKATCAAGYHPLPGRLARRLAASDPRHAHFIGIVAEPRRNEFLTLVAALYVLLPFDVIPDFVPVVGHFDDAIVVMLVLMSVRHRWLLRLRRLLRPRRRDPQPQSA